MTVICQKQSDQSHALQVLDMTDCLRFDHRGLSSVGDLTQLTSLALSGCAMTRDLSLDQEMLNREVFARMISQLSGGSLCLTPSAPLFPP